LNLSLEERYKIILYPKCGSFDNTEGNGSNVHAWYDYTLYKKMYIISERGLLPYLVLGLSTTSD